MRTMALAALPAALFIAASAAALPGETAVYGGAGVVPILDTVEYASPIPYGGAIPGAEIGAGGEGRWLTWGLQVSFGMGRVKRVVPGNDLTVRYMDCDTGEQVTEVRKTTEPLRIKAGIGFDLRRVIHLPGAVSLAVGGSLEYRFDMSIFQDYPIFLGALDLGPSAALGLPFPGRGRLDCSVCLPVLSLLNSPPFTGTSGWIIQNIYENPAAVVLTHHVAWLADRPLVRAGLAARLPLGRGFTASALTTLECFRLGGARVWDHLSVRTILALGYGFDGSPGGAR